MRIRTIKPEFWTHEKMSTLPAETALLAIALLNYADDGGFFNAHPRLIASALFPLRKLSRTVPVLLRELSELGYIYIAKHPDGREFGRVVTFECHQVINKPKDSKLSGLFSAAYKHSTDGTGHVPDMSGTTTGGNGTGNGEQGNGKEQGKPPRRLVGVGGCLLSEQSDEIRARLLKVNGLKKRKEATRWSAKEAAAFTAAGLVKCTDEDFLEQIEPLESYYTVPLNLLRKFWAGDGDRANADYRRRDLLTLLNNWSGEVDRAQAWDEWYQKYEAQRNEGRL